MTLSPVQPTDAEALADLRVDAMRESLQAVGRFDAQRARARLLDAFDAACTRAIVVDGERIGFVVVRRLDDPPHLLLDHLYVLPSHQGRGLGAAVLADVFAQADAERLPVRVGALRGSRSNRFYERHGFVRVASAEWDHFYERPPAAAPR